LFLINLSIFCISLHCNLSTFCTCPYNVPSKFFTCRYFDRRHLNLSTFQPDPDDDIQKCQMPSKRFSSYQVCIYLGTSRGSGVVGVSLIKKCIFHKDVSADKYANDTDFKSTCQCDSVLLWLCVCVCVCAWFTAVVWTNKSKHVIWIIHSDFVLFIIEIIKM